MDKELNNTINHWSYYSDNVPNEIVNMWNFILYNQFNNEEIRRLHREVKFLKQDKDELNDNINCYKRKIDDLNEEVEICKKKLKRYQPKKNKKEKLIYYYKNIIKLKRKILLNKLIIKKKINYY